MSEWTGVVVAKSPNGIKVKENGDWLNFTKDEWRGRPFDDVRAGDKVRVEYAITDGKTYISVIENLTTLAPKDEPFPAAHDFPPDDGFPAAAPESPSSPAAGLGVDVDREHSIVRQCCVKAAGMALQHNMGNAEEKAGQMTYLAGVLEDWCWR